MVMKWRFLPPLAVILLVSLHSAEAQQPGKVPRLGVLLYSNPQTDPNILAFRGGLRDLGYIDGQNISFDYRFADGKPERLPDLAADLVRVKPDVIFALGGDVVPALQRATRTIPVVMWTSNDPVQAGFVSSLARPGGNITGLTLILDELAGKRLELLKEVAPRISRVAVLWNPDHADPEFREIKRAAVTFDVRLQSLEVRHGDEFDSAFQTAARGQAEAMIVVSSRLMQRNRQRVLVFSTKNRLPLIGDWGAWAPEGALISYGPSITEMVARAAMYVDKILKGSKPSDLPIERPSKFELVVNLKTATQIGITIPPQVLARADKVIK
jgi:putative ABC transport system substrate-binding protein